MKNFKRTLAMIMVAMVFGTTAMAKEEEYAAPLPSETSREDKIFASPESWNEIIPEASEEYLNDFAGLFEEREIKSEEEAKDTDEAKKASEESYAEKIITRASEYEEETGVKVVVSTFKNFENDLSAQMYAYLTYQVYDVGPNGIVLVVSEEDKTGAIFAQNRGNVVSPLMQKQLDEIIESCFKEGNDVRKVLGDAQEILIDVYEEIVEKFNEVYVQDERELFSEEERADMLSKISDYSTKSGIGIMVVTTDSFEEEIFSNKYGRHDAWIYILLSYVEERVDIVIDKEAEDYITTSMVEAMLEKVSEKLSNEEYYEAVSLLFDDFVSRFEEQKASAYDQKMERVSLEF